MQGWRKSNEDAHITAPDFVPDHSLFAVFDGHGGSEVAKFCGIHFVEELKNDPSFQARNYEQAFLTVFVKIDKMLLSPNGRKELERLGRQDPNNVPG